jgi:hypothetical protein
MIRPFATSGAASTGSGLGINLVRSQIIYQHWRPYQLPAKSTRNKRPTSAHAQEDKPAQSKEGEGNDGQNSSKLNDHLVGSRFRLQDQMPGKPSISIPDS